MARGGIVAWRVAACALAMVAWAAVVAHATSDCTELAGAVLAGQSQVTSTFLGMAELTDVPAASRAANTPVTYLIGRGNNINSSYVVFEEVTVAGANVTEGTPFFLDNILQAPALNITNSPSQMLYKSGFLYVAGASVINYDNQTVFVYAYNVSANYALVWTATFSCGTAGFTALFTDMTSFPGTNGDIVIAGYVNGDSLQGATLDGANNNGPNPFAVRLDAATGAVVWSSQTVFSSFARSMRLACSSVSQECYMTVFSTLTKSLVIWAINYQTGATLSTASVVSNLNLPTSNDNAILVIDAPVSKRAVYIAYTVRGTGSQYNSTIFNVTPSTGAVNGSFTAYVGSVSGTNTNYLQTIQLLADASSDLYLVSRVPYGINGPTTNAGLHLRKFNGTTGAVVYAQILTAGSSSIAPSAAYLNGPNDAIVVAGTTSTVSIKNAGRSGPVDVFVTSFTDNPFLGGPLCTICVGAACPTPSPIPINTAAPTIGAGESNDDSTSATLPAWAFAIIAVAALLVAAAIIMAIVILRRRAKAQEELEKKDLELQQRAVERSLETEQRIAEAEASGYVDPFRVQASQTSQDVLLPEYQPPAYAE